MDALSPTNQAFENIFNALGANIDAASRSENLDPVLRYHLVPGVAPLAKDIEYGTVLPTAHPALPGYFDSNTVTADLLVFGPYVEGNLVPTASVGPVKVVESDIQCGGGIIHVIDNVMIPTFPDPEEDFGCDPRNFLSSGYLPGLSITNEILQYDSGNFPEFYSVAGNATAEYTFFVPSDAAWESAFQFFNFSVSDIFAEDNDLADLENINNVRAPTDEISPRRNLTPPTASAPPELSLSVLDPDDVVSCHVMSTHQCIDATGTLQPLHCGNLRLRDALNVHGGASDRHRLHSPRNERHAFGHRRQPLRQTWSARSLAQ